MPSKPNRLTCPQCRKPVTWNGNPNRPFCSERCKLVDLGRWADESYRIPVRSFGPQDEPDTLS